MREIEFRAKSVDRFRLNDIDNGWVYGDLYHNEAETMIIEQPSGNEIDVDKDTLGQYTGLKDKNGQKIFEGDIFEIEENEAIGVVVFEKGAYRIKIYGYREVLYEYGYDTGSWDYWATEDFDMYYIDQMEVIGNIYDNPELLKGE